MKHSAKTIAFGIKGKLNKESELPTPCSLRVVMRRFYNACVTTAKFKPARDLRLLEGKHDPVEQDIVDLTAVLDRCARFRAKVDTVKRLLYILEQSGESEGDSGVMRWVREKYEMNGQTVLGCKEHLEWLQQSASSQLQTVGATPVNAYPDGVPLTDMSSESRFISSPINWIADGLKQTVRTCSR